MVLDCCCESIELDRCFGSNGVGVAKCTSFINDTLASCHSIDDPSDIFQCKVLDDCDQIEKEDWIPYKVLRTWGLTTMFVIAPCFYCCFMCLSACLSRAIIAKGPTKDHILYFKNNIMSFATFYSLIKTLSLSVIILAYSQIAYQKTLYVVIGIVFSIGLLSGLGITKLLCRKKGDSDETTKTVTAVNVYQDLSSAHTVVIVTSICQVALLYMYMYSLITQGRPDFSKPYTYGFYALGAFIQIARSMKQSADIDVAFSEFKFWSSVGGFADEKTKVVTFRLKGNDEKEKNR